MPVGYVFVDYLLSDIFVLTV